MTDDEIRKFLKPNDHAWLKAILAAAVAAGAAVGGSKAVEGPAVTRPEFEEQRRDGTQVRLDVAVMKGDQRAASRDIGEIKTDLKALRESLERKRSRER